MSRFDGRVVLVTGSTGIAAAAARALVDEGASVFVCSRTVEHVENLVESLLFGLGGAIGFSLVLIIFASIRERLEAADVPVIFRGSAIAFVTAGLMSLAFMGFAGLVR